MAYHYDPDDQQKPSLKNKDFEEQSLLMALFEDAYVKKTKIHYIPALKSADLTFLTDLKRNVGLTRAKSLIMFFFKMDTFLIKTKGYTIPVLKTELNVVNAALGNRDTEGIISSSHKAPTITVGFCCDTCLREFQLVVEACRDSFDKRILCDQCQASP